MDPALRELSARGAPGDEVEVILKIRQGDPIPPGVRIVTRFGDIATCRVRRGEIGRVWEDESALSMKAGRYLAPEPQEEQEEAQGTPLARRPDGLRETGRGTIVAVVDWGLDIAHPNFRHADGSTRIRALWDQGALASTPAAPYGYGMVYTRQHIDSALRHPQPYRELGYHPGASDPMNTGSHGTHVTDIAAGNGRVPGSVAGMAPDADIIFVQLATQDTSGLANLGDTVRILEALHFVATAAGATPWVANLSVGRCGGPHTGRTLVEQGIDALLLDAPGRAVVQSAGNYYRTRGHAAGRIHPDERHTLGWQTTPGDLTGNELEVWYSGRDQFDLLLHAPDGNLVARAALGGDAPIMVGGRPCGHAYHRQFDPADGDNHVDLFLYPSAPAGTWGVTLVGTDVVDGRFDAWVERDAACATCQSYLADGDVSPSSTTGTICNGLRSIAVGAYDARSAAGALAPFSSAGPTRDGRDKPSIVAPGVAVIAARSTPAGSTVPQALLTAKSGTSMASPHVAGTIACMFEAAGRPLWIHETRRVLLGSARAVNAPPDMTLRLGSGYLDVARAVDGARRIAGDLLATRPQVPPISPEGMMSRHPILEAAESAAQARVRGAAANPGLFAGSESSDGLFDTEAVGEPISSFTDAASLFDAVTGRRALPAGAEVIGAPGESLRAPLMPGDVLVRCTPGERQLAHLSVLSDGRALAPEHAAREGWRRESSSDGWFAVVIDAAWIPHSESDRFARRLLDRRGQVPRGQAVIRFRPAAAPRRIAGPLPWDAEHATGSGDELATEDTYASANVTYVNFSPGGATTRVRVRADLAPSCQAAVDLAILHGARVPVNGSLRAVEAAVGASRSPTSLHYLGRAVDLETTAGMDGSGDVLLVVRDGGTDANPRWRVFSESVNPNPSDPRFDRALLRTGELPVVMWSRGSEPRVVPRTGTFVDVTACFERNGWQRIQARDGWRDAYASTEWFHFENHTGLVAGRTTFGEEFWRVFPAGTNTGALRLDAIWNGSRFATSGAGATPSAPAASGGVDRLRWAQAMLNLVAGDALHLDGDMGPATRAALQRFQTRESLPVTGTLTTEVEVALLQRGLEHHYQQSIFPRIGVWDATSSDALRQFQGQSGLAATGQPDDAVRMRLLAALGAARVPAPVVPAPPAAPAAAPAPVQPAGAAVPVSLPADFHAHAVRRRYYAGWEMSGGGRLDQRLRALVAEGALALTPDDIQLFQRVANVESGGRVQAINTWDNAVMSFGFMQWTLRHGQLQRIIARAPEAFARHSIALGGSYVFGTGTERAEVPGIANVPNRDDLRSEAWAQRFFMAGLDRDIIVAEAHQATERMQELHRELERRLGAAWSPFAASPRVRALLAELHVNRPAYVVPVMREVNAQAGTRAMSEQEYVDLLIAEITDRYEGSALNGATIEERRAKAEHWTRRVLAE